MIIDWQPPAVLIVYRKVGHPTSEEDASILGPLGCGLQHRGPLGGGGSEGTWRRMGKKWKRKEKLGTMENQKDMGKIRKPPKKTIGNSTTRRFGIPLG